MEYEVKDKGSKMQYKFKVGDSVKRTSDAFAKGVCLSVVEGEELKVVRQTTWHGDPSYSIHDLKGASKGLFLECEIEPFETPKDVQTKEVKTTTNSSKKIHTKTMWALVSKAAPNVIDADELFTTRSRARRCKFANDLDHLKVAKVTLTWEG